MMIAEITRRNRRQRFPALRFAARLNGRTIFRMGQPERSGSAWSDESPPIEPAPEDDACNSAELK